MPIVRTSNAAINRTFVHSQDLFLALNFGPFSPAQYMRLIREYKMNGADEIGAQAKKLGQLASTLALARDE